ncbi:unnamed protein product [Cylicostephanus goldi]|uniref:Uncharacterized protein n=1 Tax=Cylicostephanus goldi TaxID=71465 RepID=A0A3P6SP94_CYLGO|nr:unnamed protein product [Cylicostephanus goldi]
MGPIGKEEDKVREAMVDNKAHGKQETEAKLKEAMVSNKEARGKEETEVKAKVATVSSKEVRGRAETEAKVATVVNKEVPGKAETEDKEVMVDNKAGRGREEAKAKEVMVYNKEARGKEELKEDGAATPAIGAAEPPGVGVAMVMEDGTQEVFSQYETLKIVYAFQAGGHMVMVGLEEVGDGDGYTKALRCKKTATSMSHLLVINILLYK